jgi:7-cyano-7-deazaguanine reductase
LNYLTDWYGSTETGTGCNTVRREYETRGRVPRSGRAVSGGLTHLGAGEPSPAYDRPHASIIECFDNPRPEEPWAVALDCLEFTSVCPITGQPDFGRIYIQYVPGRVCVESKSLKLYLGAYRQHGAFHEACVNQIADDLQQRLSARYLRVFGDFNVRGGIAIRPLALRIAPGIDQDEERSCLTLIGHLDAVGRPAR